MGRKRLHGRAMQRVVHGDDDSVREALPAERLHRLARCAVQVVPRVKHERAVDLVRGGHARARLRARLRDGDDLAQAGLGECILAVSLGGEVSGSARDRKGACGRTWPRWPAPTMAMVMGLDVDMTGTGSVSRGVVSMALTERRQRVLAPCMCWSFAKAARS